MMVGRRVDYFDDPTAPTPNSLVPAASAIVVNEAKQILLHRRSDNNLWSVPGGAMKIGESIVDTVTREVKEETGLEVQPVRVTGIYTDPRGVVAFADGEVRQQFSICFCCAVVGGEIKTSSESTEVRFFDPGQITSLNMSPAIRLRIDHYLSGRREPAVT
jgi:ADP-ribose pyrophosphatase YjhB (NUDIX family)